MLFSREHEFDAIIDREARSHAVPVSLIKGVIAQESAFKPDARREEPQIGDASHGLMQLLAATAADMGHTGSSDLLFDPATNIHLGTKYLAWLRARYGGTWADTVSAYNGGFRPHLGFGRVVEEGGAVHCGGRNVPAGEYCNQHHVDRVLGFWRYFETGQRPGEGGAAFAGFGVLAAIGLGLAALRSRMSIARGFGSVRFLTRVKTSRLATGVFGRAPIGPIRLLPKGGSA